MVLAVTVILPVRASAKDLVVYSSVDEENARKILNEFTKATGNKVQMVFLSTGPELWGRSCRTCNQHECLFFIYLFILIDRHRSL